MRAAPVAAARLLHRRAEREAAGRFLVEGPRPAADALREHVRRGEVVEQLLVGVSAADRHADLVEHARSAGVDVHLLSDRVAAAVAATRTPQGVVAVCHLRPYTLADLPAAPRLVAVLADVADPGNAGTAIRTADACGADAIIVAGSAVDPYNPKCVRASAGSILHLPVICGVSVDDALSALRAAQVNILAADAHAATDLVALGAAGRLAEPTAWVFGNESRGLATALPSPVTGVRVPIYGRAESLNLATAVGVCLYASALARQPD